MWPVRSWVSSVTCQRGRWDVMRLKFCDGAVGSILLIFGHLGDASKLFFQRFFKSSLNACRTADLLEGSRPLIALGSLSTSLVIPRAALFASSSLLSFPLMSTCPGTHLIFGHVLPFASKSSWVILCISSTRYKPGELAVSSVARIAPMLSSAIDAVL